MAIKGSDRKIKAIAFDLGRVIFDFDYWAALNAIKDRVGIDLEKLYNDIFFSGLCLNFEKGLEEPEDFFEKFKAHSSLNMNFENFVPVWNSIFSLKPETVNLIKQLKNQYRVILISNINKLHYFSLLEKYPQIFSLFDGQVLSWRERSIKPEEKIYNVLLERAKAGRKELVYIDDRQDLIDAAEQMGFICLKFNGIEDCRRSLRNMGVI